MAQTLEERLQQLEASAEKLISERGHQPDLIDELDRLREDVERDRRRRAAQDIATPRP
jgi:hypothetical protein